jgi:TolB protein
MRGILQAIWRRKSDGTKIAFHKYVNDDSEIYVMNAADGSGQTRLTNNAGPHSPPNWSPDGTKIAYTTGSLSVGGNAQISVINTDGINSIQVTDNLGLKSNPSWSPDGEKIAFSNNRDRNWEIYVMNAADGSGQTRLTNSPVADCCPDWGPATDTEPEDTSPPVITVPEDIIVDVTTANGGTVVTYNVTAEDNVDGTATLEEDGTTITQDDVGGNITISCDPASGSEFPVGDTEVQCTATDAAGNVGGPESFTVTVNPPPPPPTTPKEIIEKLISDIQNLEGIPEGAKTRIVAFLERALALLSDDNTRNDAGACNMLGAFMNQVNANERRDMLTADQAGDLRMQAEDIRGMLDC